MQNKSLWVFSVVAVLAGCHRSEPTPQKAEAPATAASLRELSVVEVASELKEKRAVAVDANGADTRQKYGTVPGAILLSDHREYALTELPSDKSQALVFYCGGTQCRASDAAAKRALSAGYANVSVMREGIRGWASAGQPVASLPKS